MATPFSICAYRKTDSSLPKALIILPTNFSLAPSTEADLSRLERLPKEMQAEIYSWVVVGLQDLPNDVDRLLHMMQLARASKTLMSAATLVKFPDPRDLRWYGFNPSFNPRLLGQCSLCRRIWLKGGRHSELGSWRAVKQDDGKGDVICPGGLDFVTEGFADVPEIVETTVGRYQGLELERISEVRVKQGEECELGQWVVPVNW